MKREASFSQIFILAIFLTTGIALSLAFAVGMLTVYEFAAILAVDAIICASLYTILGRKS